VLNHFAQIYHKTVGQNKMIKEFDMLHLILANDLHKKATMHHTQ
jgi:hypothetical protein